MDKPLIEIVKIEHTVALRLLEAGRAALEAGDPYLAGVFFESACDAFHAVNPASYEDKAADG